MESCRPLALPANEFKLTSGSFEIPQTVVKINLKPELVGKMLGLLAEAAELGVDSAWFRLEFEKTALRVVETADVKYLQAFVDLAVLAHRNELLTSADVRDVESWAEVAMTPPPLPSPVPRGRRERWDSGRVALQRWLDLLDLSTKKKLLRQRSTARVACGDCHSMLAWLVPQGEFEFLVLARGDAGGLEVAHAVGEYGGYSRTQCGRKRGGRRWVLHADQLRRWLDDGHADVLLKHSDKGL
jgi:hypothetical protein